MDILLYFAITVTAIFVIKMILMMFGIGSDSDVDMDMSGTPDLALDVDSDFDIPTDGFDMDVTSPSTHVQLDTSSDFSFVLFTLDSILAFFMVFSWSVLFLVQELYFSVIISVAVGFVLGVLIMVLYSYLLSRIRGLETEEVRDVFPELDAEGVMYLSSKNGRGQAKFSVQGKYIIYDVYTNAEQINTGDIVVVQNISNKMITVLRKINK